MLTALCRPQGPRADPLVRRRPATAGGQDGVQVRRWELTVSQVLKEEQQEQQQLPPTLTSAIGKSDALREDVRSVPRWTSTRTSCFSRQVLSAAAGAPRQLATADVQDSVGETNSHPPPPPPPPPRLLPNKPHFLTGSGSTRAAAPAPWSPITGIISRHADLLSSPVCLHTTNVFLRSGGGAVCKNDFERN